MRAIDIAVAMAAICLVCTAAVAQDAATATCSDGTTYSGAKLSGACRGHGGIAKPGAVAATPAATAAPAKATPAAGVPVNPVAATPGTINRTGTAAAAVSTTTAPASNARAVAPAASAVVPAASAVAVAPGGGVGKVWVNASSKVYHCQGDAFYGKTKKGAYITESAAKAAGDRPSGGKACAAS